MDGVVFESPYQRGIQRYDRELVDRCPSDVQFDLLLANKPRSELPTRCRSVRVLPPPFRLLPRRWRRSLTRSLTRAPRARFESKADVFHSSHFTRPQTDIPTVVTVHDMIVERYIEFMNTKWADEEINRKRAAIQTADILIAGSQATANELRAFYPEFQSRITVVYYGCDHIPESTVATVQGRSAPYTLFVGDRGGYKNFRCLLEATGSAAWPKGCTLKVVGPGPRGNEAMLAARMGHRAEFLGRVDDQMLARLYREAAATVVPSLVEGFGFPIVESQRAACPVVCSDIEVFRELGMDSALYFDPGSPDSLAAAVARACEPSESARLRNAGIVNARRFTWEACVQQTVAAYRAAIAAGSSRRAG
jgi:glycosyltransferase involved in cell wall biosynthesis